MINKQIYIFALCLAGLLCGCNSREDAAQSSSETMEAPLYGKAIGAKPDATAQNAAGQPDALSLLRQGWKYFYAQNPVAAMKNFNQAWALNPDSDEAYYAFGFILSVRGDMERAMAFYKKALELNPNHTMALANMGRCYKEKAYAVYRAKGLRLADAEVKALLAPAFGYYEKAAQSNAPQNPARLTSRDDDLGYIYYQWAIALDLNGDYAKAWDKIKLSRKYGGERIIETGFITELSNHRPEPVSYKE